MTRLLRWLYAELFDCQHKRYCFPITMRRASNSYKETFVVCLDCGREYAYDFSEMKLGRPLSEVEQERSDRRAQMMEVA